MKENTEYEKILKFIGYPTVNKFFELEGKEITDFVEKGAKYIICKTLDLKCIDSNCESYSQLDNYETVLKIYSKIEYVKDKEVENIVDLGDSLKVKVLEYSLNVSSSKILYIEINKKLLKWI